MAEMTISDQAWEKALSENGMVGGVMNFDPPTAGKVTRRYQELMRQAGYCPGCEHKLSECICQQTDREAAINEPIQAL